MSKKARTPIIEHDDYLAIELPGERVPQERDRLSDQAMVVAYDRLPQRQARWRLRALYFDREDWTRSGIRRLENAREGARIGWCLQQAKRRAFRARR